MLQFTTNIINIYTGLIGVVMAYSAWTVYKAEKDKLLYMAVIALLGGWAVLSSLSIRGLWFGAAGITASHEYAYNPWMTTNSPLISYLIGALYIGGSYALLYVFGGKKTRKLNKIFLVTFAIAVIIGCLHLIFDPTHFTMP